MREDVRVEEVWLEGPDDDHWDAARDEELRRLQAKLAQVERERDYYLLLGRSWEQRWQREAETRIAAEEELRRIRGTLD